MSRRAILAIVLVVAAVGVGVVRTVSHEQPNAVPAAAVPVVTVPPSVLPAPSRPEISPAVTPVEPVDEGAGVAEPSTGAGRDAGPDEAAVADRAWEPAAAGFARAFTAVRDSDTTASWRARIRPYVTTAVDKQLATVDVANVPEGRLDGLDLLESSDEQVSVQATYSPGWALVVYLISDGHDHWKVYRYDRLEQ